jgi:outer membrane receptor protein involved in Fe transport
MRYNLLVRASALAVFAAGTVVGAQAQTTPADPSITTAPEPANAQTSNSELNADGTDRDGEQGEEITVTGSRIRLPNITSLQPTATVSRRYIEERGFTNAADALNELPGFVAASRRAARKAASGRA